MQGDAFQLDVKALGNVTSKKEANPATEKKKKQQIEKQLSKRWSRFIPGSDRKTSAKGALPASATATADNSTAAPSVATAAASSKSQGELKSKEATAKAQTEAGLKPALHGILKQQAGKGN